MQTKPCSIRYGDLLTDEERKEVEERDEVPLVTLRANVVTIAYDRSDVVYRIPIRRVAEEGR